MTPLSHVAAAAQDILSPTNPESDNFVHTALHGNAFNLDTGRLADFLERSKCSEGALWQQSNCEEIFRLAQGFGDVKGTNTMFFIDHRKILKGCRATYLRVVAAYRPQKANPRRIR